MKHIKSFNQLFEDFNSTSFKMGDEVTVIEKLLDTRDGETDYWPTAIFTGKITGKGDKREWKIKVDQENMFGGIFQADTENLVPGKHELGPYDSESNIEEGDSDFPPPDPEGDYYDDDDDEIPYYVLTDGRFLLFFEENIEGMAGEPTYYYSYMVGKKPGDKGANLKSPEEFEAWGDKVSYDEIKDLLNPEDRKQHEEERDSVSGGNADRAEQWAR